MDSRGEKRWVKRDRSVSSANSSNWPPAKARKIKDRPHVRKHFLLHRHKNCGHNRNRPVFPTKSTMLRLKSKSSSEMCSSWCSTCSTCSTGRSKRSSSERFFKSIDRVTTELIVLLESGKITLDQVSRAVDKFEDEDLCNVWLKMSLENKIKYVQGSYQV